MKLLPQKFTPIGKLVALQAYRKTETEGGIALPDNAVDPSVAPLALVNAVGPEVKQCKRGDKVMVGLGTPASKAYFENERTIIMLEESGIMAVIDEDERIKQRRITEADSR